MVTDSQGKARVTVSTQGTSSLRATRSSNGSIPSNRVAVCVNADLAKCPQRSREADPWGAGGPTRSRARGLGRDLGRSRRRRRPHHLGRQGPGAAAAAAATGWSWRRGDRTIGSPRAASGSSGGDHTPRPGRRGGARLRPRGGRLRLRGGAVLRGNGDPDRDPRLRLDGAGGRGGGRPTLVGDRDPLPGSRGRDHDALRRPLRAVDRRSRRRRERGPALRLVLLRQRDLVRGRLGRGARPGRRQDLVGLSRLDRRDAGSGGGRVVARAVRAGLGRGRRPAGAGRVPGRRQRLRDRGRSPRRRRGEGKRRARGGRAAARRRGAPAPGRPLERGARRPRGRRAAWRPVGERRVRDLQGPGRRRLPPDRPRPDGGAGQGSRPAPPAWWPRCMAAARRRPGSSPGRDARRCAARPAPSTPRRCETATPSPRRPGRRPWGCRSSARRRDEAGALLPAPAHAAPRRGRRGGQRLPGLVRGRRLRVLEPDRARRGRRRRRRRGLGRGGGAGASRLAFAGARRSGSSSSRSTASSPSEATRSWSTGSGCRSSAPRT